MKKNTILTIVVFSVIALFFFIVNWVILPAVKGNTYQSPTENSDGTCSNVVDITGAAATWEQTNTDELDGETISIEGFAELPFVMMLKDGRASVHLTPRMNQGSGGMIILLIEEGNCENMMHPLPSDYMQDDMLFMDNAGVEIAYGEGMRVTGKAKRKDGRYTVIVEKIEAIDLNFDYEKEAIRLTKDNADKTEKQVVFAEGIISAPDEQESIRLEMFLEDESLPFIVNCMIEFGDRDNQAAELEEEYTAKDITIFGGDAKHIKAGNKVRAYGVWNNETQNLWVEKIVLLEE